MELCPPGLRSPSDVRDGLQFAKTWRTTLNKNFFLRITVVQAAESRQGLNLAFSPRANCCWPTCWGVLLETQVRAIIVVIEHVLGHQPFEMPFIQDDYVVKQVSSATSNPALSDTVL